jgi:hypothetical protein
VLPTLALTLYRFITLFLRSSGTSRLSAIIENTEREGFFVLYVTWVLEIFRMGTVQSR